MLKGKWPRRIHENRILMCHKLWAFSSQKFLRTNPFSVQKMKPDAFLGLNRADAPCFCTKKKGSSNTHYTTLNFGELRQNTVNLQYFGPKTAKKCPGIVTPKNSQRRPKTQIHDGSAARGILKKKHTNSPLPNRSSGEGRWGRKKYRGIPKCEGD